MKSEFTLRFIKNSSELRQLSERLLTLPAFALDIETSEWWNRHHERVALIQIAYRVESQIRVVIVDALADLDLQLLRPPVEHAAVIKVIHNASFDAVRLNKHYGFRAAPVFDTMSAARRNGERKYSLAAQSAQHLNLPLDKTARNSDWSRRPLDARQLHYAALDPYATLLLYEHQTARDLGSDYRLKESLEAAQNPLPLESRLPSEMITSSPNPLPPAVSSPDKKPFAETELSEVTIALLGIVAELPTRYNPDSLMGAVGSQRIGLAGWIIDRRLGRAAEPDEATVKMAISDLCERGLIEITETRRLAATATGETLWRENNV